jgi:hypothetical protein
MDRDDERPAGIPPPFRLRPGYGLWTGLATTVCVLAFVTGTLYAQITVPTGLTMGGFVWWVRRHVGSTVAVLMDLLAAIVLIPFCAMWVAALAMIWRAHMQPQSFDPSLFPSSFYESSCCRKATDLETEASTGNCLERCDRIEEDGGQPPTP